MKKTRVLYLKNFKIDTKKKAISGILFEPKITLLSAKFISEEFPEIKGFVGQAFQKDKSRGIINSPYGFKLKEGDWFGTIYFDSDFEIIKSGIVKKFSLIESVGNKTKIVRAKIKRGQIYEKFIAINKPHEFSSFTIEVKPGSTYGSGRNEHGKPHFHMTRKNSRDQLAKIEIPDINIWKYSIKKLELLNVIEGNISKTQKREIVNFFEKENNQNLILVTSEWNRLNRDNNRVLK